MPEGERLALSLAVSVPIFFLQRSGYKMLVAQDRVVDLVL